MIGDFLLRLAVALPLLLLLAVALMLAMKRGLLPLPGLGALRAWPFPRTHGLAAAVRQLWPVPADAGRPSPDPRGLGRLDLVACRAVVPGLRVLVVRYAGHDLVLGAGPQGLSLLSSLPAPVAASALPAPASEPRP